MSANKDDTAVRITELKDKITQLFLFYEERGRDVMKVSWFRDLERENGEQRPGQGKK